jgi:hypothetical protein
MRFVVNVAKQGTARLHDLVHSAAYAAASTFKDADIDLTKYTARIKTAKPKDNGKAIPIQRDELKLLIDYLELGNESWDALHRSRENAAMLVNTLLRRRQRNFK